MQKVHVNLFSLLQRHRINETNNEIFIFIFERSPAFLY